MAEENKSNHENKQEEDNKEITLSAALLAPLNAIFEAQIHAARAFLNFVLQMGLRHQYSAKDIKELEKEREKNKEILDKIAEEKAAKKRIKELEQKDTLSDSDRNELWNLKLEWDDLRMQKFNYSDDKGNISSIFVPNLAILPIKETSDYCL